MGRPLVTQTGISARQELSLLSFQCLFYFLSLSVRFRRWGRLILPSNLCSSLREKLLLWVSAPALQRPQRFSQLQSRASSCTVRIFGEVLPAAAPGLFLADQCSERSFPPC